MAKARGYGGFYKENYLRSSLEFAYAYYLDYKGITWEYEAQIFYIDGVSYKPDFFIKDSDGNLIKIVEIKGDETRQDGKDSKYRMFKESYSIPIELINYKKLLTIYQTEMPIRLHRAKEIWKNEYSARLILDMEGEKNPMHGKKHSEKTRTLIGEKARKRFSDPTYKERVVKSMQLSAKVRGYDHLKKPRADREVRECCFSECNNTFTVTLASPKKYCSIQCSCASMGKLGNEKTRIDAEQHRNHIKEYTLQWANNNKSVVIETKYNQITNLNPLFVEIERLFGVKDKRVISKAMFGKDLGRKEFLRFLKDYVI